MNKFVVYDYYGTVTAEASKDNLAEEAARVQEIVNKSESILGANIYETDDQIGNVFAANGILVGRRAGKANHLLTIEKNN